MGLDWRETTDLLALVRSLTVVTPVTVETHAEGLRLAARYRLPIDDATIVGAAMLAGCGTLWSEDMQHGLRIDDRLTIRSPSVTRPTEAVLTVCTR